MNPRKVDIADPAAPRAASRLFAGQPLSGDCPPVVNGVARDSRRVKPGAAFVGIGSGDEVAKHFLDARAAGASALIREGAIRDAKGGSAELSTPHARWSFARASAAAHGLDRAHPRLFAVTGSAGKSTTTHCCWWALGGPDALAARVGTLGWHDGKNERGGNQTTPPPEELHAFLSALDPRCPGVAVEISSHAGDQQRLAGIPLSGLAYTGLGHDHLDYHRTLGAYLDAKLAIVRGLEPGAWCVINADDRHAHAVAHAVRAAGGRPLGLGFACAEVRIMRAGDGWRLRWEGVDHPLPVRLPGGFNAWNAAAGALLAHSGGVPLSTALARLADLPAVPGRLELLAQEPQTFVDYAHTPEAIDIMLRTLREAFPGRRLACVFGCGGDRDRSKRAPMGRAALLADVAILTTDNSRSESPRAIADDVIAGLEPGVEVTQASQITAESLTESPRKVLVVELERSRAIECARRLAGADGVVVVAGKGHETTQEIQGTVQAWDDRAFVAGLGKAG